MYRIHRISFLLFVIALLISSCSVNRSAHGSSDFNKRKYLKGTYVQKSDRQDGVERNKRTEKRSAESTFDKGIVTQPVESIVNDSRIANQEDDIYATTESDVTPVQAKERILRLIEVLDIKRQKKTKAISNDRQFEDTRRLHVGAVLSLGLLFLNILLSGFNIPIVSLVLFVSSVVLAFDALASIKRYPDEFKGKGFAMATLITYGVGILLTLFLILLLSIEFN